MLSRFLCCSGEESSDSEDEVKPKKSKRAGKDDGFEEVPVDQRNSPALWLRLFGAISLSLAMKRVHLDAEDLALGHVMAQSKKNREQLIDYSYNR